MSVPDVPDPRVAQGDANGPERHPGSRALAGIAGVVALFLSALVTLGAALAAPVGMAAARALARRRGVPHSPLRSWVGAVIATTVVGIAVFGLAMLVLDSAVTDPPSPEEMAEIVDELPGWLARAVEWAEQNAPEDHAAMDPLDVPRPVSIYFDVLGASAGGLMFGLFAGSMGWGSAALLVYAARGRWPGR